MSEGTKKTNAARHADCAGKSSTKHNKYVDKKSSASRSISEGAMGSAASGSKKRDGSARPVSKPGQKEKTLRPKSKMLAKFRAEQKRSMSDEVDFGAIFSKRRQEIESSKNRSPAPSPPLKKMKKGGDASPGQSKVHPTPARASASCDANNASSSSAQHRSSSAQPRWTGARQDSASRAAAAQVEAATADMNENVEEALRKWFANQGLSSTTSADKFQIKIQNIVSDLAVGHAPAALAASFEKAVGTNHVFLRLEMDATSRETRGQNRKIDRSMKWLASALSAWFSSEKTPEDLWPRWPYLPTNTVGLQPKRNLPKNLSPTERNARIGLAILWPFIAALPKGTMLSVVLAGDGAETATITCLLSLLDAKLRAERPDLVYMPHYHRCTVHQATICGEESAGFFLSQSGTTVKDFQRKIYLQVLQKKRQNQRYSDLISAQAEEDVKIVENQREIKELQEGAADFQCFLKDMGLLETAKDFRRCAPVVRQVINAEGEIEERFCLKAFDATAARRAKRRWVKLYQNLREPRLNRWLTVGHGARVEAVHESLNSVQHVALKKPWFFSTEDWVEFRANPHLHDRYNCMKLFVGHIFVPLDDITELLLSHAGEASTTEQLHEKARAAFRSRAYVLQDSARMNKQMNLVTVCSPEISQAEKDYMHVDAYLALLAGYSTFVWRITSGCRDPHDRILWKFRAAMVADDKDPKGPTTERQEKVIEELHRLAKESFLINEAGSVCVIALSRTLDNFLTAAEAVRAYRSFALGLRLSPSHQAACERLIAMAKSEQQALFSNHRGMLRISGNVVRRKTTNAFDAAVTYEQVGDPQSEEDASDTDSEDERQKCKRAVEAEDRRLLRMARPPNYYTEWMRATKKTMENLQGKIVIPDHEKDYYTRLAKEKKARRDELIEAYWAAQEADEKKAASARLRRSRRARVQLIFFSELQRLIYKQFASYGRRSDWNCEKHMEDLQNRLYTTVIDGWQYAAPPIELYKMAPTGVERFVAWLAAAQVGKEDYANLEDYYDEERREEYDELEAEMAANGKMEEAFQYPRSLIALSFPEVGGEPPDFFMTRLIVVLLVERSPFSFVAAPARFEDEDKTKIVMRDPLVAADPILSVKIRHHLRKYNGLPGTELLAVEFTELSPYGVKGVVKWRAGVVIPLQEKKQKQTVAPQLDDGVAPPMKKHAAAMKKAAPRLNPQLEEAAHNESVMANSMEAQFGKKVLRFRTLQFEDEDEKQKQKPKRKMAAKRKMAMKKPGAGGAAGAASSGTGKKTKTDSKLSADPAGGSDAEDEESAWSDASDLVPVMKQLESVKYNMTSEAERKNYIRRAATALTAAGDCGVDGFEFEIKSHNRLVVRPQSGDSMYLLQELPKLKNNKDLRFKEWFVLGGGRGERHWHFHPVKEGWRHAYHLAALWAMHTKLLLDICFGMLDDEMQQAGFAVGGKDAVKNYRTYCLHMIKPYLEPVELLKLSGKQLVAVTDMKEFPESCIKGVCEVQKMIDEKKFSFPSAQKVRGYSYFEL